MTSSPTLANPATRIHTPAESLRHGLVDVPVVDGTLPGYYAAPADKENLPLILVIQEIFGLHEHIKDVCRRFAHQGYMAIALELYQRQGDASGYADTGRLVQDIVSKVPDEQVLSDLDASVDWAGGQGADITRLGVTGFCWGGRQTWLYAAHNPSCKAGVAWYGKLTKGHGPLQVRNPIDVANSLHAPVLGLYGGKDASIPLADVETMKAKLAAGNDNARRSEIVVYPEADHAFLADYRASYKAEAAQDGWKRMLEWFKRYL